MTGLAKAVHLTQKYASFFNSTLTDEELHRWLITDKPCSADILKKKFPQRGGGASRCAHHKHKIAHRVSQFLSFIPTIKLIAATGSIAVSHAKPEDDIDLMIITSKNTLWLTRLFVVPLISIFFKRRMPFAIRHSPFAISDSICLNLWLDESDLSVPVKKRNLYTAHEVLQALHIFDRGNTYSKFIRANSWTKNYLANAYKYASSSSLRAYSRGNLYKFLDRHVGVPSRDDDWRSGRAISFLNLLAFRLQYAYMKSKITNETVTLHSAYFHPRDLSKNILKHIQNQ